MLDLVLVAWDAAEGGAKTYGQVVRIHLSLLAVLGQVVKEGEEVLGHHNTDIAPFLQDLSNQDHELRKFLSHLCK